MIPAHIQAKLIDEGVINERRLTSKVQRRRCPRGCGADLLAAQDMGFEQWCDPAPLTALGELQAILAGRATYRLVMGELDRRHLRDIEARSADELHVLAEHRCHAPPLQTNQARARATQPIDTSGPPPF